MKESVGLVAVAVEVAVNRTMTAATSVSLLRLLQDSLKTVSALSAPVDAVPLIGFVPLHPPDAMQLSASDAFRDKVARCPDSTVVGLTVRLTSIAAAGPAINNKLAAARTKGNATERTRCSDAELDFKIVCRSAILGEIRRSALYMRAALAPFVPHGHGGVDFSWPGGVFLISL